MDEVGRKSESICRFPCVREARPFHFTSLLFPALLIFSLCESPHTSRLTSCARSPGNAGTVPVHRVTMPLIGQKRDPRFVCLFIRLAFLRGQDSSGGESLANKKRRKKRFKKEMPPMRFELMISALQSSWKYKCCALPLGHRGICCSSDLFLGYIQQREL